MDKVISSDLVLIDDLDTPLSDLTVTIVTQPEFGAIRNREPGKLVFCIISSIVQG